MNCALPEDDDYINEVTSKIPIWLAQGRKDLSDYRVIWDWIVLEHMQNNIPKEGREKRVKKKTVLKKNMLKQNRFMRQIPTIPANLNTFNAAKENLEAFYDEKLNGVIIRARARWHVHGEKSSKYCLSSEKKNHIKKNKRKLKISGVITTDPLNILAEQMRFYQELYKSRTKMPTERRQ